MTKEQKYCIESYSIVLLDIKRNFFLILFHIVKPMRTTKRCQRKVVFSSFVERTSGGINRISHAILRCSSWVLINMLFKKKAIKIIFRGHQDLPQTILIKIFKPLRAADISSNCTRYFLLLVQFLILTTSSSLLNSLYRRKTNHLFPAASTTTLYTQKKS